MEFCLLGPLTVHTSEVVLPVPAPKHRVVLATLLLSPNRVVPLDRLYEAIWAASPPVSARVTVQNHVKRLRQILGDADHARIVTRAGGYLISLSPEDLDLTWFEQLQASARAAAQQRRWAQASADLRQALSLWRGQPLADVPSELLARQEVPRLTELRLQALEARIDAELNLGSHRALVPEIHSLTARYPLREHFHAQLMLARYRCGQQAEALAAYQQARRILADELAIGPGPELRTLHQGILTRDPDLIRVPAPESEGRQPASGSRHTADRVVPQELPAVPARFVGRQAELRTLTDWLSQAGQQPGTVAITTIGGTAGVGKSTLATYWARSVAGRFPDGQLFLSLRGAGPAGPPVAPAEAIRLLLGSLQVLPDRMPASREAQAGLLRSLLADRRMLLVLDNARDTDQVRPLLPGSPGSLVVVTSRSKLTGLIAGEGAFPVALDVLTEAEGAELLASRLVNRPTADEARPVTELITLCARLPLAVAIVGARAAISPGRPLAVLATELRNASRRLDLLSTDTAATSVRAVFSWSYDSLSAPAARVFRLLGLHPGPDASVMATASMAGVTAARAHAALTELTEANLLAEHAPGRFTFHDLLRSYAAEQAAALDSPAEQVDATGRMLDYYLHSARAANQLLNPHRDPLTVPSPRPGVRQEQLTAHGEALAWFEAEHAVLLLAIGRAARSQLDTCVWQLAWTMVDFLERRGHWHDWAATQQLALAAAQRSGDRESQARTGRGLGFALARLGAYDDAHRHLGRARALFREVGDQLGEARTHQDISWLLDRQGRADQALRHDQQALVLYQQAGQQPAQATALNAIGWLQAQLGRYQEALGSCGQALELHRELGNRRGEAAAWDSLGYARHHLGQPGHAVSCYRRSLDLFTDIGDRLSQADVLTHLGDTHQASDDVAAARDAFQRALTILNALQHQDAEQVRARLRHLETVPDSC